MILTKEITEPRCLTVLTQAEFDGAFLRLLARHEGLDWETLSREQWACLEPLEEDSPALRRADQDVLHDWALHKGIVMGRGAYRSNAPIIYMARLIISLRMGGTSD